MMFLDHPGGAGAAPAVLAISQPTHAWVAGQLLRAWAPRLDDLLILAGEQHDIAWMDWERDPSFDPATGRPHLFRAVGAKIHGPLWAEGVQRALACWGARVAWLISRHGRLIYTRYTDRHRLSEEDGAAVARYLAEQAPLQDALAAAIGRDAASLERDSALIAFVDSLSLALCGELSLPLDLSGPGAAGGAAAYRLERREGRALAFTLSPWPFRETSFFIEAEAKIIPGGRFADEPAMRAWLAAPPRTMVQFALSAV
jgi:hypothetical protein